MTADRGRRSSLFWSERTVSDSERLPALLEEREDRCRLAAIYVAACHDLRDSEPPVPQGQ